TGQSTLSTQLAQLKGGGLLEDRRNGKNILYRTTDLNPHLLKVLHEAGAEIPEAAQDAAALQLTLEKRKDRMRAYFDELAGRFGREYVPGRSWQAIAEMLLRLLPPMVIADLGAGEGTLSQLLAERAREVIAVDNSEKMVEFGARLAREHGVQNLFYRLGDLESLPIEDASVDLAIFSQSLHHAPHPQRAVAEAFRILRPAGRVVVLDLLRHHFEEAREMYADLWMGFSEVDVKAYLEDTGFRTVHTSVVHREQEPPHFETILATGEKPA
ncbi:MAG: methyltransferase domain-containing protein, partial [Acidobacteriaceae bacterium]|nr:methyltransferase domain-containing protein [Acidobacteriaceae bacterium]